MLRVLVGAVFLVTLCATSAQAQWRLGPPNLTVGHDPGAFFEDVGDVFVRDDRVFVADRGGRKILAFDRSTGHLTATVGRPGDGPGEFRFLSWIGDCGTDEIVAWDQGHRRVSLFSRELVRVRTYVLKGDLPDRYFAAFKCAGPGIFVGITRNPDAALSLGRGIPMNVGRVACHPRPISDRFGRSPLT